GAHRKRLWDRIGAGGRGRPEAPLPRHHAGPGGPELEALGLAARGAGPDRGLGPGGLVRRLIGQSVSKVLNGLAWPAGAASSALVAHEGKGNRICSGIGMWGCCRIIDPGLRMEALARVT